MSGHGIQSIILLPLVAGGEPMGVLLLAGAEVRRFTELDRRLVELWMAEASAILTNRQLYEGLNGALQSLQRVLQQREMLYEVNTRIQHAPGLGASLSLIAELSPRALEVDECVVCLTQPGTEAVLMAAVSSDAVRAVSQGRSVDCSTCTEVIRSGELRLCEDASHCPVLGFPQQGSALYVPLHADGAVIGLLVLLRRRRAPFDPEQIRTAEVFAARASSAIVSTRLHEQTRRQADSNATLLRELNHRVGNNFASIIGLLRVAANELPAESRHPLERAVERVHLMARAHELFSGGVQSVSLDTLVKTTLASISAVRIGTVRITSELDDPDVELFSSRAVTLAMVLHELAFNAVVHALAQGGDLLVRARRSGNELTIQVIDRVTGPPCPRRLSPESPRRNGKRNGEGRQLDDDDTARGEPAGIALASIDHEPEFGGTGIGLHLVRNLVSRELQGKFHLDHAPGGTIATIEFALEQENECRL
jgi:two-component system, sensor histidine kinase PdtaS